MFNDCRPANSLADSHTAPAIGTDNTLLPLSVDVYRSTSRPRRIFSSPCAILLLQVSPNSLGQVPRWHRLHRDRGVHPLQCYIRGACPISVLLPQQRCHPQPVSGACAANGLHRAPCWLRKRHQPCVSCMNADAVASRMSQQRWHSLHAHSQIPCTLTHTDVLQAASSMHKKLSCRNARTWIAAVLAAILTSCPNVALARSMRSLW